MPLDESRILSLLLLEAVQFGSNFFPSFCVAHHAVFKVFSLTGKLLDQFLQIRQFFRVIPVDQPLQFSFVQTQIPVFCIYTFPEEPVTLGFYVIDAQCPEEPFLPPARGIFEQGQEVFLGGIDRVPEVDRAHAERPPHLGLDLAHPCRTEFSLLVEGCVMLDRLSLFECAVHRVLVASDTEIESYFGLIFRACERGDNVVRGYSCRLDTVQGEKDRFHDSALACPVVAEDAGYPVLEPDLLVPETLEIFQDDTVDYHGSPPGGHPG